MTTGDVKKADVTHLVNNNVWTAHQSLSVNLFVIGNWTIEQGQFTKVKHCDM